MISDAVQKENYKEYADSLESYIEEKEREIVASDSLLQNKMEEASLLRANNLDLLNMRESYEEETKYLIQENNKIEKKFTWWKRVSLVVITALGVLVLIN